jgi:hypothetical protein
MTTKKEAYGERLGKASTDYAEQNYSIGYPVSVRAIKGALMLAFLAGARFELQEFTADLRGLTEGDK